MIRAEGISKIELEMDGVELSEERQLLIRNAMAFALECEGKKGNVTILITKPDVIRQLNREFRNVDRVTDVLTFPAWEGENVIAPPDGYLGDVAICLERAYEQAESYGHSPERELGFLTVHGALHLLGYDHMTPEEESIMFEKQREILDRMGLKR